MAGGKRRALGLALALILFVGCGRAEAVDEQARSELSDARAQAREALEAVGTLAQRVQELQSEVRTERKVRARLQTKLRDLSARMKKSLTNLEESLSAAQSAGSTAGSALDKAESALDKATSAAQDLAVMDKRLDYHLGNHGGG